MNKPSPVSYWLASAPDFTGGARGSPEGKVDVAIIGGGFTGLSAALALRRRGASVTLLEAGKVVGEAAGRNGGHCNAGTHQDHGSLIASLGEERASAFYRAHCDAVDTVERIVRDQAIDCSFRRCGRLKLAAKPGHFEKMMRAHDLLYPKVDPDIELLSASDLEGEIGAHGYHGGLLQKTSAQLHVGQFGVGLAEAAARAGARIFETCTVLGAQRAGGGWALRTTGGTVHATQVLLATGGAPAQRDFRWFQRRMVGIGAFVIATSPLDDALIDRLMPRRRNYVTSRVMGNFFRLSPDNRLIFGGRARFAISNARSDARSGVILIDTMRRMFPELAGVGIDHVWGGMVDMTADRLPRAGQHEGLHYAVGYSGHGVQMATHMGERMAACMSGDTQANPWENLPWPAIPGHLGKPWFLPAVGLWYKFQDAIH